WMKDPWGEPFRVVKVEKKRDHKIGVTQFDYHEIVSAGPDGKFGTEDDVKMGDPNQWQNWQVWWSARGKNVPQLWGNFGGRGGVGGVERRELQRAGGGPVADAAMPLAMPGPGGGGGGAPPPAAVVPANAPQQQGQKEGGAAAPMRVREYFPETLLW